MSRGSALRRLAPLVALALLASLLLAGCYTRTKETFVFEPIEITSVALAATPRPQAAIRGTVGDGCSEPDGTIQERTGTTITITVMRKRRTTGGCRDQQKVYDQVVPLRGDFDSGRYEVIVNGTAYGLVVP